MSKFKVGDIVTSKNYPLVRIEVRGVGFFSATRVPRIVGRTLINADGEKPLIDGDRFYDENQIATIPKIHKVTLVTYRRTDGVINTYIMSDVRITREQWIKENDGFPLIDWRVVEIEIPE